MIGYLTLASCVDFPLQDGKIGERLGESILVLKGSGINARANAGVNDRKYADIQSACLAARKYFSSDQVS